MWGVFPHIRWRYHNSYTKHTKVYVKDYNILYCTCQNTYKREKNININTYKREKNIFWGSKHLDCLVPIVGLFSGYKICWM